jgi:hypothetical protein
MHPRTLLTHRQLKQVVSACCCMLGTPLLLPSWVHSRRVMTFTQHWLRVVAWCLLGWRLCGLVVDA